MLNQTLTQFKSHLRPWDCGRFTWYHNAYHWQTTDGRVYVEGRLVGRVDRTFLNPRLNRPWLLKVMTCRSDEAIAGQFAHKRAAIEALVEIYADNLPLHAGKTCDCAVRWGGVKFYPGPRWPDIRGFLNPTLKWDAPTVTTDKSNPA